MAKEQHPIVFIPSIKMIPADRLNPAPYNPRKIIRSKIEGLKAAIKKHGFIHPMVVQKKGNVIIGGHARLISLKEICFGAGQPLPDLPSYVLDVNDRVAKQLNISLNNLDGEFDLKLLAGLVASIDTEEKISGEDASIMGMDDEDILGHLRRAAPDKLIKLDDDDQSAFGASATLTIKFDMISQRDKVKNLLTSKAERDETTPGQALFTLLSL